MNEDTATAEDGQEEESTMDTPIRDLRERAEECAQRFTQRAKSETDPMKQRAAYDLAESWHAAERRLERYERAGVQSLDVRKTPHVTEINAALDQLPDPDEGERSRVRKAKDDQDHLRAAAIDPIDRMEIAENERQARGDRDDGPQHGWTR